MKKLLLLLALIPTLAMAGNKSHAPRIVTVGDYMKVMADNSHDSDWLDWRKMQSLDWRHNIDLGTLPEESIYLGKLPQTPPAGFGQRILATVLHFFSGMSSTAAVWAGGADGNSRH